MQNILAVILRNQLSLFYRFGYNFIPRSQLCKFDGKITDQTKNQILEIFSTLTPFEWDDEYIVIHLQKEIQDNESVEKFDIQDLVSIYPLSRQAKLSIESKIDTRIQLGAPLFEDILSEIETKIQHTEIKRAIEALWCICEMEGKYENYLKEIGETNIFNGLEFRKHGTKASKIANGNYWEYLIAYDRYDYFPNSILGYFYDSGQVFAFSRGRTTFEGSAMHSVLMELNEKNPNLKMKEIISILESEEKAQGYINQSISGEVKQYFIAPIFLMLRDEIRKVDNLAQSNLLKHLKTLKEFEDNFKYAVILLGAFFGFKIFYDAYYDKLNLRFYKSYSTKTQLNPTLASENKVELPVSKQEVDDGAIVSIQSVSDKGNYISQENELTALQNTLAEQPFNNDEKPEAGFDEIKASLGIQIEHENIIAEVFQNKPEVLLSVLVALIKEKTGEKVTNTIIKKVIEKMENVEVIPKKRPEMARRKPNNKQLPLIT